jgi:hypothetical protein
VRKVYSVAVVALLVLALSTVVYVSASASDGPGALNAQNESTYQHDVSTPCSTQEYYPNGTFAFDEGVCAKAEIALTTSDSSANYSYLREGFWASCLSVCPGVVYRYDPTALMTNGGHDYMFNCKDFGVAHSVYCEWGSSGDRDNATIMMLSTSSSSLAVTDTGCGGGSGSGQITTGGLADVAGTFTAGTPSAGAVTSTLAYTWTAAETDSSVQVQCINTELHTGSHVILVYEFTFGPVSLVSGNTLAITDSLTAT